MKVKELIEILKRAPQDAEVETASDVYDAGYEIHNVGMVFSDVKSPVILITD